MWFLLHQFLYVAYGAGGAGPSPGSSGLLLEDDISFFLLEDNASVLLLE